MTREEAITLIKSAQLMLINPITNEPVSDLYEALDMAIQALSQEPTFDDECQKDLDEAWKQIQKKRKRIPITQKSGKWIGDGYGHIVCSCCKSTSLTIHKSKFCPDCGAEMESEDKTE